MLTNGICTTILENETYNNLKVFGIQTNYPIPTRIPNLVLSIKKICRSGRLSNKNKRKRKDREILGLYKTAKKKAMKQVAEMPIWV